MKKQDKVLGEIIEEIYIDNILDNYFLNEDICANNWILEQDEPKIDDYCKYVITIYNNYHKKIKKLCNLKNKIDDDDLREIIGKKNNIPAECSFFKNSTIKYNIINQTDNTCMIEWDIDKFDYEILLEDLKLNKCNESCEYIEGKMIKLLSRFIMSMFNGYSTLFVEKNTVKIVTNNIKEVNLSLFNINNDKDCFIVNNGVEDMFHNKKLIVKNTGNNIDLYNIEKELSKHAITSTFNHLVNQGILKTNSDNN